jgi:hypothetical protein
MIQRMTRVSRKKQGEITRKVMRSALKNSINSALQMALVVQKCNATN